MSTPFNYLAGPSQPPLEDRGKIRNILGGKHWIWCLMTPFLPKSYPGVAPTAATSESMFPVEQQLISSLKIRGFLIGIKGCGEGKERLCVSNCCCETFQGVGNTQTLAESHLGAPLCCSSFLNLGIYSLEKSSYYFNLDTWNEALLSSGFQLSELLGENTPTIPAFGEINIDLLLFLLPLFSL